VVRFYLLQKDDAMKSHNVVRTALSLGPGLGLSLLLTGCAGVQGYPQPANPFLHGTPALDKSAVPQPTKVGLVWLVPAGATAPPEAAQRALAEKIKNQFTAGKRLEIVEATTIPAPLGEPLSEIRKASASFNVQHVLVVMPNAAEVTSPVWLQYGRNGRAVGTRTDSYISVALVAVDLSTGKNLFSVVTNGEARLLKPDYEDARPWYPRISPGRSSAFIFPDGPSFPPGQVSAVALEQAVNGLIYKLDRAIGS
jgi:hypothetical protein